MTQSEILWIDELTARGKDYVNEVRELRSRQIHTCGICGTRTNQWSVAYWMGYPSLRLACPYRNDGGTETNEINKKHAKLQAFQDRLWDAEEKGLTKSEIAELNVEMKELRDYFSTLKDHVIVKRDETT